MKSIRIEINPDLLLQLKVKKVTEQTGVSIDLAVKEAVISFLSAVGSNNLECNEAKVSK